MGDAALHEQHDDALCLRGEHRPRAMGRAASCSARRTRGNRSRAACGATSRAGKERESSWSGIKSYKPETRAYLEFGNRDESFPWRERAAALWSRMGFFNRCALRIALLVVFGSTGVASVGRMDSVEWMTCAATVVAVGKVKSVTTVEGTDNVVYRDCILEVVEAIKGVNTAELEFSIEQWNREEETWMTQGNELLVFLSPWNEKDRIFRLKPRLPSVVPPPPDRMNGRLTPTVHGFFSPTLSFFLLCRGCYSTRKRSR